MIEAKDLRFTYRCGRKALSDVSFDLGPGHCLAMLGNNGAGKSTLLKCLNRILTPESGVVTVSGQNISKMKRNEIARKMAYVEQHNEASQLTVFDAVLLGRKPYIKMEPSEEDIEIAQKAIGRMELESYALRYVNELSGGELQKVVLARALTQQPDVLHIYNQHEVMRTVSEIAKKDNILVIVVIHDLNLAVRYCDRFMFVKDGEVYCYGDSSVLTDEVVSEVYRVPVKIHNVDGQTIVVVQ